MMGAAPKVLIPLKRVEVLQARDGIAAGETLFLAVRVSLNREFHVNSHVPSQEYLIPTRIEAEPSEGMEFGEWTYPEGEMKKFPFSEEPLKVYEGTFIIRGSVRVSARVAPGAVRGSLRLRYQACTREKCLAPKVEEIPLDFPVAAPGTVTRPINSELFPPGP